MGSPLDLASFSARRGTTGTVGPMEIGMLAVIEPATAGGYLPTVVPWDPANLDPWNVVGVSLDYARAIGDPCRIGAMPGQVYLCRADAGLYAVGDPIGASSSNPRVAVSSVKGASVFGFSLFAGTAAANDLIPILWRPNPGMFISTPAEIRVPQWLPLTLTNGYTAVGAPSSVPGYFKQPDGSVEVRFVVTGGTNGAVFATLPAGYRPGGRLLIPSYVDAGSASGVNWTRLDTDGTLRCLSPGAGISGINGFARFMAEN